MNRLLAILATAAMIGGFVPMTVTAQPQHPTREQIAEAEILAARGKAKFKEGQFLGAAELFQKAYALSGSLGVLYNLARAKAEAGHLAEARELFRLFVTKTVDRNKRMTDEDSRAIADAEREISKIDDKLAELAKPKNTYPAGPDQPKAVQPHGDQLPETSLVTEQAPPSRTFNAAKLNGWKAYVAGGLAISGVGLMFTGRSFGEDANARAPITTPKEKEAYKADFATGSAIWWTGLTATIMGAGFATWATLDAFEEAPASEAATNLKVIPTASPQGAGLAVTGRF